MVNDGERIIPETSIPNVFNALGSGIRIDLPRLLIRWEMGADFFGQKTASPFTKSRHVGEHHSSITMVYDTYNYSQWDLKTNLYLRSPTLYTYLYIHICILCVCLYSVYIYIYIYPYYRDIHIIDT